MIEYDIKVRHYKVTAKVSIEVDVETLVPVEHLTVDPKTPFHNPNSKIQLALMDEAKQQISSGNFYGKSGN